jgi:hypothetical protein
VESTSSGSLESGGRFCVGTFDRNLDSVAVKMFSHLIYIIKNFLCILYFQCDLQKNNAAVNCTNIRHRKGLFAPTLTGHTLG